MVFSFVAGLLALKWLSRWLEGGRWKFFGFYCLIAAAGVLLIHFKVRNNPPVAKNHFAFGSGMKIFFPTIRLFAFNPGFAARIWSVVTFTPCARYALAMAEIVSPAAIV